jgi:ABC-type spermidine/putrescine transport system permease subunit II
VGLSPVLNAISTLFIAATVVLVLAADRVRRWNA